MSRKISGIVEWLLERFGIPQRNESLMGDLMEEYSAGRSGFWLLRQIVNAIATTMAHDITHHSLLTARAIAMGWALWFGWARTVSHLQRVNGFVAILSNLLLPIQIVPFLTFTLWPAFIGWLVARTHRAQQPAMVLAYAASLAIYDICSSAIQWPTVKRLYFSPAAWWEGQILFGCVVVFFTLIGGFFQKPRGLIHGTRT
jgi:hypothetical protein